MLAVRRDQGNSRHRGSRACRGATGPRDGDQRPREILSGAQPSLDRNLSSGLSGPGLVNKPSTTGLAVGAFFPLVFASEGRCRSEQIAVLAAVYPANVGVGPARHGGVVGPRGPKRWLIVGGMLLQARRPIGISSSSRAAFARFALRRGSCSVSARRWSIRRWLAAIWRCRPTVHGRASSVGVYRLWRDLGYADRSPACRHHRGRGSGLARRNVDRRRTSRPSSGLLAAVRMTETRVRASGGTDLMGPRLDRLSSSLNSRAPAPPSLPLHLCASRRNELCAAWPSAPRRTARLARDRGEARPSARSGAPGQRPSIAATKRITFGGPDRDGGHRGAPGPPSFDHRGRPRTEGGPSPLTTMARLDRDGRGPVEPPDRERPGPAVGK